MLHIRNDKFFDEICIFRQIKQIFGGKIFQSLLMTNLWISTTNLQLLYICFICFATGIFSCSRFSILRWWRWRSTVYLLCTNHLVGGNSEVQSKADWILQTSMHYVTLPHSKLMPAKNNCNVININTIVLKYISTCSITLHWKRSMLANFSIKATEYQVPGSKTGNDVTVFWNEQLVIKQF